MKHKLVSFDEIKNFIAERQSAWRMGATL